jgi:hypothetical protein
MRSSCLVTAPSNPVWLCINRSNRGMISSSCPVRPRPPPSPAAIDRAARPMRCIPAMIVVIASRSAVDRSEQRRIRPDQGGLLHGEQRAVWAAAAGDPLVGDLHRAAAVGRRRADFGFGHPEHECVQARERINQLIACARGPLLSCPVDAPPLDLEPCRFRRVLRLAMGGADQRVEPSHESPGTLWVVAGNRRPQLDGPQHKPGRAHRSRPAHPQPGAHQANRRDQEPDPAPTIISDPGGTLQARHMGRIEGPQPAGPARARPTTHLAIANSARASSAAIPKGACYLGAVPLPGDQPSGRQGPSRSPGLISLPPRTSRCRPGRSPGVQVRILACSPRLLRRETPRGAHGSIAWPAAGSEQLPAGCEVVGGR